MEELTCRLLPYAEGDGPTNMATDETLLHSAVSGVATLRFYGWTEPTLSLGYFQRGAWRTRDPHWAALPYVRRPSGGDMLVHHRELTYALALPVGAHDHGDDWPRRMHSVIVAALAEFGISASLHADREAATFLGPLCFQHFTAGDVILGGRKIAGSAQRRHRGALLQHGGILLAQSPSTPQLPGIEDLAGKSFDGRQLQDAIVRQWQRMVPLQLVGAVLTIAETGEREALRNAKYLQTVWNDKRL